MKKLMPLLLALALLFCGCVRQPAATAPPETDPPATDAPTAPPDTEPPETDSPETEPPETTPPSEPTSNDDDDYNLVFYFFGLVGSGNEAYFIASDQSDVWIPLQDQKYSPYTRATYHEHLTRWAAKFQCNYPGKITGTWRLLVLELNTLPGPDDSFSQEVQDRLHNPKTVVKAVYEFDDIVIQDKTTMVVERMAPSDYDYQPLYEHIVFDTMPMVFCDLCPEEWLAQWDGEIVPAEEAPFYEDWGNN